MGLPMFLRRVLGTSRFPQMVGQELPDPVPLGQPKGTPSQAERDKATGRKVKPPKPKP